MDKERIIQEFVPGKQVTLAHLIAHPGEELVSCHIKVMSLMQKLCH